MSAQRMHNADAAWLHMDRPTNLMIVNSVLWFEEPFDLERAREILSVRLLGRFPRFRQIVVEPRLGLGVPSWVEDPNFDLNRHIHHLALPAPGDKAALEALVSDLMVMPLDRSKPLWDAYLVDGYRSGMALVTRMHHCIADGIALARVLLSLTDAAPDAGIAPDPTSQTDHGVLGSITAPLKAGMQFAQAGLREGAELLAHPGSELGALASRGSADAHALAKLLMTPSDAKTIFRGELGVARRVTWSDPIPLEEIKAIGHATGTTVNDVLVAAMTGALRRYLLDRGSAADEIRTMVPFNLRPLDQPLPRELGNHFGLVYLTLPIGIEDAHGRLDEVHQRMEAIKHSPEGILSYGILEAIGLTPPQIEQRLLDVFAQKTTAVLTNVPGPRQPIYFAGSELAGIVAWVPAAGTIGMGLSIMSYNGGVTVGFQVDAGLVPDPETIVGHYEHEVEALSWMATRHLETLPPRPRPRARRRSARSTAGQPSTHQ